MAKYKPYDYRQSVLLPVSLKDQLMPRTLEFPETLSGLGVDELLICGMMTQNCVTHTAISKAAEKYTVTVLPECCATVDEMLHNIALHALSTRVSLVPAKAAI